MESEATRAVHRTVTRRDLPFITNSWLKSNRRRSYRYLEPRLYYHWHHKLLEALIPASNVRVVCDREDPDRIYGYGVAQYDAPTLVVHYLYVKDGWRGLGIGTSIVRAWLERFAPTGLVWTHTSSGGEDLAKALRRREVLQIPAVHNPYLAWLEWSRAEIEKESRA